MSDRWRQIQDRVKNAAQRAGRDADGIEIMAVTKTKPVQDIRAAQNVGISFFGENRVQEAREKYTEIAGQYRLHLIGHLQRNKAKLVPGLFHSVESIDKVETAQTLNEVCDRSDVNMDFLIEINTSGESTKNGYEIRDALHRDMNRYLSLDRLRLAGLMTIAPFTQDEATVRTSFASLRELLEELQQTYRLKGCTVLSMGMSADFEWAILEGSTRIRVGSSLFGARV